MNSYKDELLKTQNFCGKKYDICILTRYSYEHCRNALTPKRIDSTPNKIYRNVELLNINGLGTGQVHFTTEEKEYILIPWSMIIWMLPSEKKR